MASFFTRALDRITPWNRSGEVQRRKKREEEQLSTPPPVRAAPPSRPTSPLAQRSVNLFDNSTKQFGLTSPNRVVVSKTPDVQSVPKPQPGQVINPTNNRNRFEKIRDQLDVWDNGKTYKNPVANTDKDKEDWFQRNRENLTNPGQALAREVVFKPVANAATSIQEELRRRYTDDVTPVTYTPGNRVEKFFFGDQPLKSYQQRADEVKRDVPDSLGVIKSIPTPLLVAGMVAMDLPGGGKGGKVVKEGGELVGKKSVFNKVSNILKNPFANKGKNVVETTKAIPGVVPSPSRIPVKKNIPVASGVEVPTPVRVRNMTEPKPLIREVGGDARIATPDSLVRQFAEDAREEAARAANSGARPDRRIEGISPVRNEPFRTSPSDIDKAKNDIIEQYADMMRGAEEGAGVQLVKNPNADSWEYDPGMVRQSSHSRFYRDYYAKKGRPPSKKAWREEAEGLLRTGHANPTAQQIFDEADNVEVQSLLAQGERPDVPVGRPITVKEIKGIPVRDETNVPQNLPETPGTVRVTEATAPMAVKSEAVANAPVVSTPPPLPKEVQAVLDNPKQYNKRQVDSARNQRRLARQLAKTQEETSAAMQRVEAARGQRTLPNGEELPGYGKTGEITKGKRSMIETKNRELGVQQATQATQNTSVKEFIDTKGQSPLWSNDDMLEAEAIFNRTRKMGNANEDELRVLSKKIDEQASREGQDLAMRERLSRKADTSDKLTDSFVRKFYAKGENGSLTDEQISRVEKANQEFTAVRDDAARKFELANDNPTKANVKAYEDAVSKQKKLDKQAAFEELRVAREALKKDKSPSAAKFLKQLEEKADVPNFDYVNANNLSGTGTILRNNINNALIASERVNFTGSNVRNIPKGLKEGLGTWWSEMIMRGKAGGKNPINWVKNWTTSGNTAGDIYLRGVANGDAAKYYRNQLKSAGITGEELTNRIKLLTAQDPDNIAETAFHEMLQQAGLASLTHGGKAKGKIENMLTDSLTGYFGNVPVVKNLSKGLVNTLFGYPTITIRNAMRGLDRQALGIPNLVKAGGLKLIGQGGSAKVEVRQAARNLKSGAILAGLGAALYNSDAISFGYPKDQNERDRWKDERKSEYSIKIGGAWYPLPSLLGPFAIPLMTPGVALDTLKNGGNAGDVAKNIGKMVVDSSTPIDDINDVAKALQGEENGNWWAQKAAMLAGSQTPASGLLRQIAKIVDPTVRTADRSADFITQTYQNIVKGLPGFSSEAPAMLDSEGQPFKHPNAAEVLAGASTKENQAGVQRSADINQKTNDTLSKLDQYGLLNDPNLDGVLEGSGLEALKKSKQGQQLDESDIKALKEGLVKGVTGKDDTAYLEREEYDTNLNVLKLKRDLMNEDKTTKPSSLKDIDTAIKRGEVYKDNQIPYDLIDRYKTVGLEDWRKMGDPDSDEYDPDLYQQLADIDQLMAQSGVSYAKGKLDKNKYYLKESKAGSGGRRSRASELSSDFGRLEAGDFAPKVQAYQTIDQQSGGIPIIRTVRPNIRHVISSSR